MTALYRSSQWYLDGLNNYSATGNVYGINWAALSGAYDGSGIKIGSLDIGVDYTLADLSGRVDIAGSEDSTDTGTVSVLPDSGDWHGTATSGEMVSNGVNIQGIASGAMLDLYYYHFTGFPFSTLSQVDQYFTDAGAADDVVNNSWGSLNLFGNNFTSLTSAIINGRSGLGTEFVFSAGNERSGGANTVYHELTDNRHVITVGATVSDGGLATFSDPGDSILLAAPGDSILTDYPDNHDGDPTDDVTNTGGTSFSAPAVTATIALMLDANSKLGYRDIQNILAITSHETTSMSSPISYSTNGAANWNGSGMHTSHDVGFGLLDTNAAVHLAESWNDLGNAAQTSSTEQTLTATDSVTTTTLSTVSTNSFTFTVSGHSDFMVDWLGLDLTFGSGSNLGDLTIDLISPDGTDSSFVYSNMPSGGIGFGSDKEWIYNSTHSWGEFAIGTWTLNINDTGTLAGGGSVLKDANLYLYGNDISNNNTMYFTDEFHTLGNTSSAMKDANGGTDTVNFAALSSAVSVDLQNTHTSTIDGVSGVATDGNIENVIGTHFNDTIVGNSSNNILNGGVGADSMSGGIGDDTYYVDNASDTVIESASSGHDTVISTITYSLTSNVEDLILRGAGLTGYGNSADNTLYCDTTGDTLVTGGGNDVEYGGAGNDVLYNTSSSGTTVYEYGNGGNDYFYGGGSGTTNIMVQTGSGVSVMVGDAGYAYMFAGNGGDYEVAGSGGAAMVGGNGADHEYSGAANDVMTGGSGNDVFVFGPSTQGHDVVTDFSIGHDIAVFDHTNFATASAVLASMTSDAGGVYVNHGSDWAYFQGHVISDFHTSDFLIV